MAKMKLKAPKISIKELNQVVESRELEATIEKELLGVLRSMRKRVKSNQRADGRKIKNRYSKSYIKQIEGGRVEGKKTTNVNLAATREFLSSIQVGSFPRGGKLFISGDHAGKRIGYKRRKSPKKKTQAGDKPASVKAKVASKAKSASKSANKAGGKKATKREVKRTKSFPNATLFRWLEEKGYKGWFEFSKKERIKVLRAVARLVRKKKKDFIQKK